jgi:hypothetical protein
VGAGHRVGYAAGPLLPDGQLRSPRWWVVATAVAGPVLFMVGALLPGPIGDAPVRFDNPFGLAGVAGRIAAVVLNTGLVLHWGESAGCGGLRGAAVPGLP